MDKEFEVYMYVNTYAHAHVRALVYIPCAAVIHNIIMSPLHHMDRDSGYEYHCV